MTVGADGEADESLTLLVQRRTGFLGDKGYQARLDVLEDSANIRTEVDALGIGENLSAPIPVPVSSARSIADCNRLRPFPRAASWAAFRMASPGV